jgi:hypothetical protein
VAVGVKEITQDLVGLAAELQVKIIPLEQEHLDKVIMEALVLVSGVVMLQAVEVAAERVVLGVIHRPDLKLELQVLVQQVRLQALL